MKRIIIDFNEYEEELSDEQATGFDCGIASAIALHGRTTTNLIKLKQEIESESNEFELKRNSYYKLIVLIIRERNK